MTQGHTQLDLSFDRRLLEDVFDSPDLRYVVIFMFIIRKELFNDLEDDDLQASFESLKALEEPTVGDLKKICDDDFLKKLFQYNVISNIKSYEVFQAKSDETKIKLVEGLTLTHEDISKEVEEIHIFMNEQYLERLIAPKIPEMTANRIHAALERLRAMMCPRSSVIHVLVHKYGDFYVLDDSLYNILETLGNPYQAIRVELLIRGMAQKYKEIDTSLTEALDQFDPNLSKSDMMNKFKTAKEKQKTDFLAYLVEKSRKLAHKYDPKFPEGQVPEIYLRWKTVLNALIALRLKFDELDAKFDTLRAYYSGKKQVMPYLTFIEKTTFDDEISEKVKALLVTARDELKSISEELEKYSKKDLKLLNLDYERAVLELGLEEETE